MNIYNIEGNKKHSATAYEADANRFSVKCQFLTMIFPFITWILNCAGIFTVEGRLMSMSLLFTFVVTVLTVVICSILFCHGWNCYCYIRAVINSYISHVSSYCSAGYIFAAIWTKKNGLLHLYS